MNRKEAKAAGERFYTGSPCPNGHGGLRYVTRGTCVECAKVESRRKVQSGYFKAHYAANSVAILAQQRASSTINTQRNVRTARAWAMANPDKRRAIASNYKHRRRAQEEAGISGGMLAAWTLAQPKVCFYCTADCAGSFHVDHFMPLAKGGAHVLTNLRIACPPCNLRKNARDPMEFMERAV